MDELIPITRIESFLDGIVNGSAVPDPETRIETFLAKIAGENVVTPEPITRLEVFLAKISGVDIPIPQPITRIEMFLAIISGEDILPPNPITRIEMYLAQWAEGASGTIVTVSGVSPLSLVNAVAHSIKSLTQYGKCVTSGGDIVCNNGVIKARHQSGLPIGYQKLDHVVGRVGQTVVDTGVRGDLANLRIVFRGKKTSHTSYSPFFGNYKDENTNVTRIIEGGNASSPVLYTYNRKAGGGSASATGILSEDAHTYDLSSSELLVDNDKSFPIRDVSGTSNSSTIAICSSAVPASAASSGASTVFVYFKMYQGETLIRNYVPVKRLSDNKVGFYELVNDTFEQGIFASSYAFTAGSPVDDPVEIYIDGTPETLTVSGTDHTQTASVVDLFAVGDVKDEQDIISGKVIRRTEAVYSDGAITIQALDTPVTETVTAQHLSTAEGTNTVSVTSNVDPVELEVQYTKGDE